MCFKAAAEPDGKFIFAYTYSEFRDYIYIPIYMYFKAAAEPDGKFLFAYTYSKFIGYIYIYPDICTSRLRRSFY